MSDIKPRPEQIDAIVAGYRGRLDDKHIHLRPDIPAKKLHNAIRTYAPDVVEDEVLGLLDDTMLGSGKDGCLVTATTLYGHDAALSPVRFDLARMRSLTREGKGSHSILRADGSNVTTVTLAGPDALDTFARLVADIAHPERAVIAAAAAPEGTDGSATVHLVLSHLLTAEWHRDAFERTSKASFVTSPLTVSRPAEGRSVESVRCPECGRSLDLTVTSHRALVESMKRWGLVLLGGLILVAAAVGVAALGGDTARDSTLAMAAIYVLGCGGALVATVGGVFLSQDLKVDRDHGVKMGEVGKQTLGYTGGWAEHSVSVPGRGAS